MTASPSAANTTDSTYTVTAAGAGVSFCVEVKLTRSPEDDYESPGATG
ncbi:hypothetical protein [Streptomyces griseicoloratus]|nr:hypothetical protein [Streptomyces griseicoloratus]